MKYMFASDLHGSLSAARAMARRYEQEGASRLIFLGDLLYHGPRNDLPDQYAPKQVIPLLNEMRRELFCVRGNCEAEVDQMVLQFPVLAEYALLDLDGTTAFVTHGHVYNLQNLPPLKDGDLLIHGHTHLLAAESAGSVTYLNPGSVAIPKGGNPATYMIYENRSFSIRNMEGHEVLHWDLPGT